VRSPTSWAAVCTLLLGCGGTLQAHAAPSQAEQCPRACLEKIADRYLDAYVAHDPARLPVTKDVTFVENAQPLKLGEGTWQTVSGMGAYKHYFADPEAGQIALIGLVREGGTEGLFNLRLRIQNGRIGEVETVVTHDPQGAANYEKLGRPDSLWMDSVPAARRATREELAAAADRYFSAMQNDDGHGDYSFFADDCNRLEHGLQTTNGVARKYGHADDTDFATLSCRAQFESGFLGFVTRIRDRRYIVVDVERQSVFAFALFDHDGTVRSLDLTTGRILRVPPYFSTSRTLQVGEAFHIESGKIRSIEMTLHEFPYGQRSVFAATALAPAQRAQACGRVCLETLANAFLHALTTHDPRRVPFAVNVKFTQNEQPLQAGDGLWGTATSVGPYRVTFADPQTGQVGVIARITELDIPGILALRLAVSDRKISEIEAIVAREEKPGQDTLFRPHLLLEANPAALRDADPVLLEPLPEAKRSTREQMRGLVNAYFDAMQQGRGGVVALADDCERRDNAEPSTHNVELTAMFEAPDTPGHEFHPYRMSCAQQLGDGFFRYIGRIRDRRELLVDEERGLIFVTVYVDIPGNVTSMDVAGIGKVNLPASMRTPCTLVSPQLFRIEGGQIRRIEAVNLPAAFGARSTWLPRPVSR
jgi:hypothetical protein